MIDDLLIALELLNSKVKLNKKMYVEDNYLPTVYITRALSLQVIIADIPIKLIMAIFNSQFVFLRVFICFNRNKLCTIDYIEQVK
jgi:hypothetical protein